MTTVHWVLGVPAAVVLSAWYVLTQPDLFGEPVRRFVGRALYPIFDYTSRLFGI